MSATKRPQIDDEQPTSTKRLKNVASCNKWNVDLIHKGPLFSSLRYESLPKDVFFKYNGVKFPLSENTEEVAYYYAKLYKKYANDQVFKNNFFKDWLNEMTDKEKALIKDLSKCNFSSMAAHHQRTKNQIIKEEDTISRQKNNENYGYCNIDGRREKVKNYKITPPGLFVGNSKHPLRGRWRRRVMPEDVTINCSEKETPAPPIGQWKEVKHDKSVSWLASWINNVTGETTYMQISNSSKLRGKSDLQKFETARDLHKHIESIRNEYRNDWKHNDMKVCQQAVALYLIDVLGFRVGNKKGDDEADGVGCCSLRVEHVELNESNYEVKFNFEGKCSKQYKTKKMQVEEQIFEKLKQFKLNKKKGDRLFDKLTPISLNRHLKEIMPGFTVKVFRTRKASILFEKYLNKVAPENSPKAKYITFEEAVSKVAKFCNHKNWVTTIENYIDPRIIVAWCKKHDLSIEEVLNKSQLEMFHWAIDVINNHFKFATPDSVDEDTDEQIWQDTDTLKPIKPFRCKLKQLHTSQSKTMPDYFS